MEEIKTERERERDTETGAVSFLVISLCCCAFLTCVVDKVHVACMSLCPFTV